MLTHYDFWSGNVLWQGETVTGVIDWSWDVFALTNSQHSVETWLPNYRDLGRTDLTAKDLRQRHNAWTEERLSYLRKTFP